MDMQKTIDTLRAEGFAVSHFATGAEAADYLCSAIHDTTVGFGGSQSVKDLNLIERLGERNTVFAHGITPGEADAVRRQANASEVYIASVNGLAETGELINIDGCGNRVSALLYGPKRVYFVVGQNKIAPDFASALHRARNIAGPLNARRLNKKTPCALGKEVRCYDCKSPERICRGFTVTNRPLTGFESMEVVLIDEDLGY